MKNIAIINATRITEYALLPVADGRNAVEKAVAFAGNLPGVSSCAVLATEARKEFGAAKVVTRHDWNARLLFSELAGLAAGCDNVFYFFADCPLLDAGLAARMFEDHRKYFSDYTFADGYPYGLAVEIIKTPVINALLLLVKDSDRLDRETIFEVLKRDINSFDLETEISPVDLRMLRVSLAADTKRNFMLLQRLIEKGGRDERSVLDCVAQNPNILRTLPAYFNVQIVEGCPQACSYCPYPVFRPDCVGKKSEMDPAAFRAIVEKIAAFADDAVVSFSLWGEPSFHSRISELIGLVLAHEKFELVIETSGIGWDLGILKELAAGGGRHPQWIVSLDAMTPELYEKVRGPGFIEATGTARALLELFPGRVHVQAVRMLPNEEALERFYREWKKETDNVIIQKYDHFAKYLPDRKITDLSPLCRNPCWHLKRDIAVLLDGTVPLCREDVKMEYTLGNILSESLEEIWTRGERHYLDQVAEKYAPLCRECDEYYTFNF